MNKNEKKAKKANNSEQSFKLDRKTITRIFAGALAALMVLGTLTMTIMYLLEAGHVH